MSNTFGHIFKITTFGESHGKALGCIVDGCPPHIPLSEELVQEFLNKRKPGQHDLTSPRQELDQCEILSGVQKGKTIGSPIAILIRNHDQKPKDYEEFTEIFRPSHADFTYNIKYKITPQTGGGRSSARETVGRVAAGAVAKSFVKSTFPHVNVCAWTQRIASVSNEVPMENITTEIVEKSPLRCPDETATKHIQNLLYQLKQDGNTAGGVIGCYVLGLPAGLGDPVFDKLEAQLAKAMLSIPASKSFEVGSGLQGTFLTGKEHNDIFYSDKDQKIKTKTNHSGGIQGGISNGMPLFFQVGFKPVSTIFSPQHTINSEKENVVFSPTKGRHDPCVLPRAVPIIEAMTWIVLADHILRQKCIES